MSDSPTAYTFARSPRVEIKDGRSGQVEVRRLTDTGMETLRGNLLDLSRGGAKISLDRGLLFDESISLSVSIPEIDLQFTVDSTVVWCRAGDADTWIAGCSFQSGLPAEVVDRLAAAGYLDRQASPRYPVALRGTVCWELSAGSVAAVVQDLSSEGFCMLCRKSGEPGQRLKLRLSSADGRQRMIAARSRWQIRTEEGFLVGCAFLNPYDFHVLWQMAQGVQPAPSVVSRLTLPTPPWVPVWFSALVVFLMAYPALVRYFTFPTAAVVDPPAVSAHTPPGGADILGASQVSAAEPPDAHENRQDEDGVGIAQQLERLEEKRLELQSIEAALETSKSEHRANVDRHEKTIAAWRAEVDQREREAMRLAETSAQALRQQQAELAAARSRFLAEQTAWKSERESLILENAELQLRWEALQRELQQQKANTRDLVARRHTPEKPPVLPDGIPLPEGIPANSTLPPDRAQRAHSDLDSDETTSLSRLLTARGQSLLAGGNLAEAAELFRRSAEADPTDALSRYLLALSQLRMGDTAGAEQTVKEAARIEATSPLSDWGRAMERHQGSTRLWLERARGAALNQFQGP
jgi:hypothetical protein